VSPGMSIKTKGKSYSNKVHKGNGMTGRTG